MTLFLLLSIALILVMLYAQFNLNKSIAFKAVEGELNAISSRLDSKINSEKTHNFFAIEVLAQFFKKSNIKDIDKKENLAFIATLLEQNQNFYAVYFADKNDEFLEIINLNGNESLAQKYKAKPTDKWLLIKIKNNKRTNTLLDKNLKITAPKIIENTTYSPAKRSYYKQARLSKKAVATEPHFLYTVHKKAVAYAKHIGDGLVVSVGVLTQDLDKILKQKTTTTIAQVFMLSKQLELIASSSNSNDLYKVFINSVDLKTISPKKTEIFSKNDKQYIYSVSKLNDYFVISVADLERLVAPYMKDFKYMVGFTIVFLLLMFPIVWYVSSFIVKPILLLEQASKRIKNRDFANVHVESSVKEIISLSSAISDMSRSIKAYQEGLEDMVKQRTKELEATNKELKHLSITDKLTNLYNRNKIDIVIDAEIERSKRYSQSFGLMMIDIDFFKSVNDEHGHQVGDLVLVEFSELLLKNIRSYDVLGRWGGEEFLIVCPQTNLEDTVKFAQKLRMLVDNYEFSVVKNKTASFGVTIYSANQTIKNLIANVDKALYEAKNNGRNQVKVAL